MKFALVVLLFELLLMALLFGTAGRIDLPWVWALVGVHTAFMTVLGVTMDPGLRRERLRRRDGGPDRRLRALLAFFILASLVLAGLDARFGWTPGIHDSVRAAGLLVYSAGLVLAGRAMVVNRFFIPSVRIQSDRGHQTVTAGPYRFLRHPGYAGMALAVFAECFVLGSLWALVPAAAVAGVLAWRTAGEDRLLCDQLPGYAEYARRVRYRLIPVVW